MSEFDLGEQLPGIGPSDEVRRRRRGHPSSPANPDLARVIANRGEFPTTLQSAAGANSLRVESRKHMTVGNAKYRAVRFVYSGFYVSALNVETNCGNSQIIECAAELVGAPNVTRVARFNGASSGVIPDGAARYVSDWIPASEFGLAWFPENSQFFCRERRDVQLGQVMPRYPATGSGIAGEGTFFSNGASPSQVNAIGAMATQAGGSSLGGRDFGPICMEGLAVTTHDIAVLDIGDSIAAGMNDTNAPNGSDGTLPAAGGGWIRRALKSVNGRSIPHLQMAYAGTQAVQFVASFTKRAQYFPYCTHLIENYGTNDFASAARTAAQIYADRQTIWAAARAGGIRWVEAIPIVPRTSSTDAWATVVNQTPVAGYAAGAGVFRDPMNNFLATALASGLLNGVVNINSVAADGAVLDAWQAGVVATADGTHPSPAISALLAPVLAARAANWWSPG